MKRVAFILTLLTLLAWSASFAHAQQASQADRLAQAHAALDAGDYPRAEETVRAIINLAVMQRAERAEAYRILGILKFYEDAPDEARAAFLSYLKLDPDGHLDPALVPPEAITLMEDVRANHQAEIESMRFVLPPERYFMLNFLPMAGQLQNGETTKGVLVATSFTLLLATNLGSYALLKRYCHHKELTCESSGGTDKTQTSRTLKTVNLLSGIGLVTVYLYSVVDGIRGYRKLKARDRRRRRDNDMSLHVSMGADDASLSLGFHF